MYLNIINLTELYIAFYLFALRFQMLRLFKSIILGWNLYARFTSFLSGSFKQGMTFNLLKSKNEKRTIDRLQSIFCICVLLYQYQYSIHQLTGDVQQTQTI